MSDTIDISKTSGATDVSPEVSASEHSLIPSQSNVREILAGTGRNIDEMGGFDVEISETRSPAEIAENRPGPKLREKILNLPDLPGVYMYIDKRGTVIYIGKAKRLMRRVSSYFNRRHDSMKTNLLVRNIADLRYIVVHSEEDALHLDIWLDPEDQPVQADILYDGRRILSLTVTDFEIL